MCRYMKSSILVLVISTLVLAAGCTRLPASEETGLGPGEYEGIVNTQEIKKENVSLKEELEKIKSELEDLEKEYLSLAKSNESIISKLQNIPEVVVIPPDLSKYSVLMSGGGK
jgi:hypothetical protein